MRNLPIIFVTATLALCGFSAWANVTPEDQKLIDAASCEELIKEHASNNTTAGNVVDVATLAVFGLGFFSWDDQADTKTNLAELTAYREAIAAAAKKKNCKL
jgi:hypothetical protein